MLLSAILVLTASVVCALATPLNITSLQPLVLDKREAPTVKKNDYTEQETEHIMQGHLDAIEMASMVISQSKNPATFDPIFKNYFRLSDREAVIDVFKQIVGSDTQRSGNSLLKDIKVVKDSVVDGKLSCAKPETNSELLDYNKDNPELVVCPRAFETSAIGGNGSPDNPVATCEVCYPRISPKMWNIGAVMLHEYTHWYKLMSPVMRPAFKRKVTKDRAYGPFKARLEHGFITAEKATTNADSYAWFASEVWWTQACVEYIIRTCYAQKCLISGYEMQSIGTKHMFNALTVCYILCSFVAGAFSTCTCP